MDHYGLDRKHADKFEMRTHESKDGSWQFLFCPNCWSSKRESRGKWTDQNHVDEDHAELKVQQ